MINYQVITSRGKPRFAVVEYQTFLKLRFRRFQFPPFHLAFCAAGHFQLQGLRQASQGNSLNIENKVAQQLMQQPLPAGRELWASDGQVVDVAV